MRKIIYLFLCFTFVIGFCACGNSQSKSPAKQETSNANTSDTTQPSDALDFQEADAPNSPKLLATEQFCSITDISEEWLPNRYLVYGVDCYGVSCYGIWNSNGEIELLYEYAAYYPLADGNLLVTYDSDMDRSLRPASHKTTDISHGKIIDLSGNILFEAAENQRMHIINSSAIMVVEASSGFNGTSLQYGLIDHEGDWIRTPSSNTLLSAFLLEFIEFENGEFWNYTNDITVVRCEGYDGLECQSIMFCKDAFRAGDPVLIYDIATNAFFEVPKSYGYYIYQASSNEWLLAKTGLANVPWGGNSYTYSIIDHAGQETGSINQYHTTINNTKYWSKCTTFAEELVIGSDNNPEGYTFPAEYSQRIERIAGFTENQIWLIVQGADERMYFTSHDMEGNTVIEPTLLDGFSGGAATIIENHLVCYDSKLYVLDPVSSSLTVGYVEVDDYPEYIWPMGNNLVALKFRENKTDYILIYSLDGQCLYQSTI